MTDTKPTEKRCPKCGEIKPLEAFSRDNHAKDGRQNQCKMCNAAYHAANADRKRAYDQSYRAANAEHIRENKAAYYAANVEKFLKDRAAYYAANGDKVRKRNAAYQAAHVQAMRIYKHAHYIANFDKIREQKAAYQEANADKIREYMQAYQATNADRLRDSKRAYNAAYPDVLRAARQRRRARIKGNGGTGFTAKELTEMRAAQNGICAYCQYQYDPDHLQVEHIIPLAQGGRHEAPNICLACPTCNNEKRARTPEQWTNRWYQRRPPASED